MRLTLALLSGAVAAAAVVQPHQHAHKHAHQEKRQDWGHSEQTDIVVVPGPTEIAYVLNGHPISQADVEEGLRNGTLVMAFNGKLASEPASLAPSTSAPPPPPSSTPIYVAPTTSSQAPAYTPPPSSAAPPTPSSSYAPPPSSAAPKPQSSASSSAPKSDTASSATSSGSGVDTPFPDGQLDCSTFPSQYGAIPVDWMNLGGWTGVQNPGSSVGGYSDILTVTHGGSSACSEGSFCSYACPAGYQKSQWPSTQGATGQSVGGILCQNGKLHLTNPGMAKTLCMTGAEAVTVTVENKLSQNVAVCRTDYPGTEGETIPLNAAPGTTSNLTCPDANNYYNWEGGHTSAQYYVNPAGVTVQDACQWGSSANPWGNFAPLNLGVGYSNGAAWLSIFQNAPTTSAKLDFSVEIVGHGVSGTCKYSNGQYCSGPNYDQCSATTGCTVSLSSGSAKFVFS